MENLPFPMKISLNSSRYPKTCIYANAQPSVLPSVFSAYPTQQSNLIQAEFMGIHHFLNLRDNLIQVIIFTIKCIPFMIYVVLFDIIGEFGVYLFIVGSGFV